MTATPHDHAYGHGHDHGSPAAIPTNVPTDAERNDRERYEQWLEDERIEQEYREQRKGQYGRWAIYAVLGLIALVLVVMAAIWVGRWLSDAGRPDFPNGSGVPTSLLSSGIVNPGPTAASNTTEPPATSEPTTTEPPAPTTTAPQATTAVPPATTTAPAPTPVPTPPPPPPAQVPAEPSQQTAGSYIEVLDYLDNSSGTTLFFARSGEVYSLASPLNSGSLQVADLFNGSTYRLDHLPGDQYKVIANIAAG